MASIVLYLGFLLISPMHPQEFDEIKAKVGRYTLTLGRSEKIRMVRQNSQNPLRAGAIDQSVRYVIG